MTDYTNVYGVTEVQRKIMLYIDYWVHTEKTPIPQKRIVEEMKSKDEHYSTVIHALTGLIKAGYIRRAITPTSKSNKAFYVMLRRI